MITVLQATKGHVSNDTDITAVTTGACLCTLSCLHSVPTLLL
jgi:hypothetical protein